MKLKKTIALLLALAMCLSLCACGAAAKSSEEPASDTVSVVVEDQYEEDAGVFASVVSSIDSFESASLPYYNKDVDHEGTMDVFYINGNTQVPYVSLDTMIQILIDTNDIYNGYSLTKSQPDANSNVLIMTRDNGSTMELDFDQGLLTFSDIDNFVAPPEGSNGLDIIDLFTNGADNNMLIEHKNAFYKAANTVSVCLADYGIPMIFEDGEGYLPLQTIADLLISRYSLILTCNGQAVLLAKDLDTTPAEEQTPVEETSEDALPAEETAVPDAAADTAEESKDSEPTLGDIYFSAPTATKSEMLKIFNYNELCLALDCNYGLKAEHEISTFNNLFLRTGLCDELMSDNALDTFTALSTLTNGYLADMHSGVSDISYMADYDVEAAAADINYGRDMEAIMYSQIGYAYSEAMYSTYRAHYYPDGCPGYEEVGNTAYITFDHFVKSNLDEDENYDYYANEPTNNIDDTLELLMYANDQIKRENSPIENVVIDLTNNGGGDADTAVAVIAWMLGSCSLSLEDTISGAQSTAKYTFDANRDGQMDASDYLGFTGQYHLYCLISPCSFSCGNLVPAALSASHFVSLIGDSSTGGACCVYPMTTADGTVLQISGPYRISTMNNGIYYSVDQGVDPDYYIDKLQHLYDREYLTNYINDLP